MKPGKIVWNRVVLLLAGVVALCGLMGLAYFVLRSPLRSALNAQLWKTDPALAAEATRALIDLDLPPGYQPEKVLSLKGEASEAVIIVNQDHPSDLIFISQTPDGILANDEWRTVYEERGAHQIAGQFYDTQITSTQTVTIRGQPTTLRLLEGTDQKGQAINQLVCMFTGGTGEILLVMVASRDTWDQVMVDTFLNSIR